MSMRPVRGLALSVTFVSCVLGTSACRHVKPWERAKLAHPTMAGPSVPGPAEEHVYAVQEGAVGGGGSAESGCGCN